MQFHFLPTYRPFMAGSAGVRPAGVQQHLKTKSYTLGRWQRHSLSFLSSPGANALMNRTDDMNPEAFSLSLWKTSGKFTHGG